ncbi:Uncharacterized protein SCF082_LOCUS11278 [Durusdinium trenchii]|uniref:Uncharacterized protein n=1 Tax=Durusdinium trenchii TaxID=1381693 RepID=A0ABP0JCC2_9DINO
MFAEYWKRYECPGLYPKAPGVSGKLKKRRLPLKKMRQWWDRFRAHTTREETESKKKSKKNKSKEKKSSKEDGKADAKNVEEAKKDQKLCKKDVKEEKKRGKKEIPKEETNESEREESKREKKDEKKSNKKNEKSEKREESKSEKKDYKKAEKKSDKKEEKKSDKEESKRDKKEESKREKDGKEKKSNAKNKEKKGEKKEAEQEEVSSSETEEENPSTRGEDERKEESCEDSDESSSTDEDSDKEDGSEEEKEEEEDEDNEDEEEEGKDESGSEEIAKGKKRKDTEEDEESLKSSDEEEGSKGKKKDKKRKKKHSKKEKKKKESEKPLKEAEDALSKNSTTNRAEWQQFQRWLKNSRRCPAKIIAACKSQETRRQLFVDFLNSDKDFKQVEAKFEARLMESQRTQVRYGFRNDQWLIKNHGQRKAEKIMARKKQLGLTIPDPEFPGEDEVLFFVMVEFNIDDIKELRRVTQIELTGTLDADGLRAFVDAGGCLDGKQHLSLGEMAGSSGMKSLADAIGGGNMGKIKKPKNPKNKDEDDAKKATVEAEQPIAKAQSLLQRVLRDVNACTDHAFKLRPLALSTDLITQLKACAVKLQHHADVLQSRISKKYNKSKYYRDLEEQVEEDSKVAKDRIDLAKALIRAQGNIDITIQVSSEEARFHCRWVSDDPSEASDRVEEYWFDANYQDEDLMQQVGRIASRAHPNTLEFVTLSRYRALLELFVHQRS